MNVLKCPTCGVTLTASPFQEDRDRIKATQCTPCRVLEPADETKSLRPTMIEERRSYVAQDWLNDIGIPMRLLTSRMDGIPQEIRLALEPHLAPIRDGLAPATGFGLLGSQGCRKSGTLVVLLRSLSARRAMRLVGEQTVYLPHRPVDFLWVDWPTTYGELSRSWGDPNAVNALLRKTKRAELLILDDLGLESFRRLEDGNTPYAMGVFQEMISFRNAKRLPIWWTTNCDLAGLASIYEGATLGRLVEDNPPIQLPDDMRNYRLPGVQ